MNNPITYLANIDEYTIYFHQEMKHPDREKFVRNIIKEVKGLC